MQHTIVINPCMEIVQQQQTAPVVLVTMFDENTQAVNICQLRDCAMDTYAKMLNKASRDSKTLPPEMAASVIASHLHKTFGIDVMGFPADTVFCLSFDASKVIAGAGPQEIKLDVSYAAFAYSKEITDVTTKNGGEQRSE